MNWKQQLFQKNRIALIRAFENPDATFNGRWLRVSGWFQASLMMSKKNIEFGNKYIILLREEAKDDVEKQVLLDRLDELRLKALERLKKREEKKAKLEAQGIKSDKPDGRRRKKVVETNGEIARPTAHLWGRKDKSDASANQEKILLASDPEEVA